MTRLLHTPRRAVIVAWSLGSLLSLSSLSAHAIQLRSETNFFLGPGERLEEELWLMADEVAVEGTVTDDLLVLSRNLDLGGTAEGDVWAAVAEHAVFDGIALQQVRIVAQSLIVSGRVDRSLAAFGGTIQLTSNTVVNGDVLLAAQTATIKGTCKRDLRVAANRFTLQGKVMGDVRVFSDDIALLPGSVIEGDFIYTSKKDVVPGKGVTVNGKLERKALPDRPVGFTRRAVSAILHAMAAFLTGLVALRLFPAAMGRGARLVRHSTGLCSLVGVAAFFVVPFIVLVGVVVAVTRPLGLMAGGLLLALIYLGKITVGMVIGSALLRYRGVQGFSQTLVALGAGLGVLYILSALPTIGLVVWLVASTVGLGALVVAFATRSAKPPPFPPGMPRMAAGPDTNLDQENTEV